MSLRLLLSLCCLLLIARVDTATADTPSFDVTVAAALLDPDGAEQQRLDALQQLKAAAKAGDHGATCLLGRLAFAGDRHAARLPDFEAGDAAGLLSRCVMRGDLDAMLVMAELEIRDKRPLEAMIWVQSYLKLAGSIDPAMVNDASAYKAGILARIEKLYYGKRPDNEEILEYVAGFLASYGERIVEAYRAGGWASMPSIGEQPALDMLSSSQALMGRHTRDYTSAKDELVFATYLLEVGANGKPARILTVEAYPNADAARSLKSYAISRRFNEIESDRPRWLYLPVYVDNKAYDLLPDAGSNYRPAGN